METIKMLATLEDDHPDTRDPFSVDIFPEEVKYIKLIHEGKNVDISSTVRNLFRTPAFICRDVCIFWEELIKNPEEYVIDFAKQFSSPIITK